MSNVWCRNHPDEYSFDCPECKNEQRKDAALDRAYALGFLAGWNAGMKEDNELLARVQSRIAPLPSIEEPKS